VRIVLNHLTRMQPGYICVAGIEVSHGRHVRPVLRGLRLKTDLLRRSGGPFGMAALMDLGNVTPHGSPPEVEDHIFDPSSARFIQVVSHKEFFDLLDGVAARRLVTIFGPELRSNASGMSVDIGQGQASLGCLVPAIPPRIIVDGYGKVRVLLNDEGRALDLSLTDLRVYETDQKTPKDKVITDLDRRIQNGERVVLSMGLARPFMKKGDTQRRHYLQVNNVHMKSDPTWQG
jgi:hypothetical protein